MWRRLVGRAHPDAGGDHDLFIWSMSVRDAVCRGKLGTETRGREYQDHPSRRREASTTGPGGRVPFEQFSDFADLTARALGMAGQVGGVHGALLEMLTDCYPLAHLAHEQGRGASYKRLAAAGHMVGMTKVERVRWYRLAESIPLSDRHVGHILARLNERAA